MNEHLAEHVLESRHSIGTLDELEEKAEELVEKVEHAITLKLVEAKPLIAAVKDGFNRLLRGPHTGRTRIMGCKSFREFCPLKLHRSYKQVMSVLHNYEGRRKGKRTTVRLDSRHRAHPIPTADVVRLQGLGSLYLQLDDARRKQDKAAEAKVGEEISAWVQADPKIFEQSRSGLQSEVVELKLELKRQGDELARLRSLVVRLLTEIEKVDSYSPLPADLMRIAMSLRGDYRRAA